MELEGHRHERFKHRDDLTGEHRWGDIGQLILLVLFLIVWIGDSFFLHYSTVLSDIIPLYVFLPLSAVVLTVSLVLASLGMKTVFGEERETPQVITGGVFACVRHPIYLAAVLLYCGLFLSTLSLLSLIPLCAAVIFYYKISRYEERLLLQRFGAAYREYSERVPMLLPIKIKKRR
jgi:protein-S-isoprenylcysteine O-methyltransferase Ste14